jgi:hypothetical protein
MPEPLTCMACVRVLPFSVGAKFQRAGVGLGLELEAGVSVSVFAS